MSQATKSNFLTDVREEIKKVTWPTRAQTIQITSIVLIATIVAVLYIGAIDYLLSLVLEKYVVN